MPTTKDNKQSKIFPKISKPLGTNLSKTVLSQTSVRKSQIYILLDHHLNSLEVVDQYWDLRVKT